MSPSPVILAIAGVIGLGVALHLVVGLHQILRRLPPPVEDGHCEVCGLPIRVRREGDYLGFFEVDETGHLEPHRCPRQAVAAFRRRDTIQLLDARREGRP